MNPGKMTVNVYEQFWTWPPKAASTDRRAVAYARLHRTDTEHRTRRPTTNQPNANNVMAGYI